MCESGRETDRERERLGKPVWSSTCHANMPYEVISAIRNRNVNRFILCAGHSSQASATLTTPTNTGNWQRSHENFDLKVSTRFLFNTQPWTSWQTCMTLCHGCHVATSSLKTQASRPRLTSVPPLEANDKRDQATAPCPNPHLCYDSLPFLLPLPFPFVSLFFPLLLRLLSLHWVIKSCASVYWERDCVEEQLSLSSY